MTANEIGLICDAVTKIGIAGKQAFAMLMAIKALEILVTGGVIIYVFTILLSTIRKSIATNSFCSSLTRIVGYKFKFENELNEEAKKKITDFVVENMTDKKE